MIQGERITVAATATLITDATGDKNGHSVSIQNPSGGATIYLGGSGVTSSSYGYALAGGMDFGADLEKGEMLYAITASGTQIVNVMRVKKRP